MARLRATLTAATDAAVLAFTGVATLCWLVVGRAGLFGLPLALLLAAASASYAIVIVEYRAQGRAMPVLGIEMLNPAHDARGVLAALLLAGCVLGTRAAWVAHGPGAGLALGLALLAMLPASVALLCVDDAAYTAVSPLHLARLIRALAAGYLVFLGVAGACGGALWWIGTHGPAWLAIALAEFVPLALAAGLGDLLHERRDHTHLDTWHSPEQQAARAHAALDAERETLLMQVHGSARMGRATQAWETAQAWLAGRPDRLAQLRWLRDRAALWEDAPVAERAAAELIGEHLRLGAMAEALAALREWLAAGRRYRPRSAAELARLIGAARVSGDEALATALLHGCDPEHAGHPEIAGQLRRNPPP